MVALSDVQTHPSQRRVSLTLPLAGFLFAVFCTVLPILAHLYLPLVDLPNHIARLAVAGSGDTGPLAEYYGYHSGFVPNAAVDLLWLALGTPGSPARFAQLVMAFYAVNLIASIMVLSRVVHGRWSLWSAAAGLLVFSMPFFMGFQNYIFSLPFAIHGLALWLALERRGERLRWLLFIPIALALYVMHLFAFSVLATAALGRETQRLIQADGPLARRLPKGFVAMLPFLPPLVALAMLMAGSPGDGDLSHSAWGGLEGRREALLSPAMQPDATGLAWVTWVSLGGYSILVLLLLRLMSRTGPRLALDQRLVGSVLALALLSLTVPDWLHGVAFLHVRFPVAVLALLIAGTSWHNLSPPAGRALAVLLAMVMAAKGLAFERLAARHDADMRDMLSVTEALPAGARILPLRSADWQKDGRLLQAQGLLVAERDAFVPTLFQHVHGLQVRPEWAEYAHPAWSAIDLRHVFDPPEGILGPDFAIDWQRKFTHVLIVDPAEVSDPRIDLVNRRGRISLYRVLDPS